MSKDHVHKRLARFVLDPPGTESGRPAEDTAAAPSGIESVPPPVNPAGATPAVATPAVATLAAGPSQTPAIPSGSPQWRGSPDPYLDIPAGQILENPEMGPVIAKNYASDQRALRGTPYEEGQGQYAVSHNAPSTPASSPREYVAQAIRAIVPPPAYSPLVGAGPNMGTGDAIGRVADWSRRHQWQMEAIGRYGTLAQKQALAQQENLGESLSRTNAAIRAENTNRYGKYTDALQGAITGSAQLRDTLQRDAINQAERMTEKERAELVAREDKLLANERGFDARVQGWNQGLVKTREAAGAKADLERLRQGNRERLADLRSADARQRLEWAHALKVEWEKMRNKVKSEADMQKDSATVLDNDIKGTEAYLRRLEGAMQEGDPSAKAEHEVNQQLLTMKRQLRIAIARRKRVWYGQKEGPGFDPTEAYIQLLAATSPSNPGYEKAVDVVLSSPPIVM